MSQSPFPKTLHCWLFGTQKGRVCFVSCHTRPLSWNSPVIFDVKASGFFPLSSISPLPIWDWKTWIKESVLTFLMAFVWKTAGCFHGTSDLKVRVSVPLCGVLMKEVQGHESVNLLSTKCTNPHFKFLRLGQVVSSYAFYASKDAVLYFWCDLKHRR